MRSSLLPIQLLLWNAFFCPSHGAAASYMNSSSSSASTTSTGVIPACGFCSLQVSYVDVTYWPAASSNMDCLKNINPSILSQFEMEESFTDTRVASNTANMPFPLITAPPNYISGLVKGASSTDNMPFPLVTQSAEAPIKNASNVGYAVGPNGFTYSSPYAYVVFKTIEGHDNCGPVGAKYTSITMSFAPGALYTGGNRGVEYGTFNFGDLPCPPASVSAADWYNYKPGYPYAPVIVLPMELQDLDPNFKTCGYDVWEGYDPPYALSPAVLAASIPYALNLVSPADLTTTNLAAAPTAIRHPETYVTTTVPPRTGFNLVPVLPSPTPDPPSQDQASTPPAQSTVQPVLQPAPLAQGPSSQDPAPTPPAQSAQDPPSLNSPPSGPAKFPTISALPFIAQISQSLTPVPPMVIIGSQTVTPEPITATTIVIFLVEGQTLFPNGPAITVSGATLSLGPTDLIIDSSTYALPSSSVGIAGIILSPFTNPNLLSHATPTANGIANPSSLLVAGADYAGCTKAWRWAFVAAAAVLGVGALFLIE